MTFDLGALIENKLYAFMLIFCRVGAVITNMPGPGETFIPVRIRLQFALALSFILLPFLGPQFGPMPSSGAKVAEMIILEFGVGIFLGLIMRLLLLTLETAGQMIALQIGLSSATIFNPALATQASLPGALLSMLALVVLFETGLFEMMLRAITQSYVLFKPGQFWPIGDMTAFLSHTVNQSFVLALQLVAPFMILGIVFQVIGGLMVKMIPQMQIFFVSAPLQIIFGLAIFAFSIGSIITVWAKGYEDGVMRLFTGGA